MSVSFGHKQIIIIIIIIIIKIKIKERIDCTCKYMKINKWQVLQ